ncbi:hypothetical protein ACJQWK_05228 [Exserohilum turcicum]|uniref:F-box domain-containing protein n=1 Tax=Exserohilum turcicum (strain 28A) TaxID=671987 RepID=R0JLG2_EXST2|nr:uncharacterized protein SETTUDRAFT_97907 [Exserohilum turcica Et28A]EOA82088.1 hypothetical protein SETTUDRAFT_97907 [Exserohilum turcica Et28A]
MAVLTDLPIELLEQIYHALGSIDDVHHLARACKKTHHVISRRRIYLDIMRSIIHFSPQHRYDYQLCKMLDFHQRIVTHVTQHRTWLPVSQPSAVHVNVWEATLAQAVGANRRLHGWSDRTICEILARYQGLRVLEDMWLARQLEAGDYLCVEDTLNAQTLANKYHTLVARSEPGQDTRLPRRCPDTPHTQHYNRLNAEQRGRFHAAVVCVWLYTEIRWAMIWFAQPTGFNVLLRILEYCKAEIALHQKTPVLDRLDQGAVFSFMYHHLLPLHISFLADQESSKLPLTFDSDFDNGNGHCHRMFQVCLMAGQVYLQPPDLIDLAVRSKLSRKPPYPRMTMPASSERWRTPLPSQVPPNIRLWDNGQKRLLLQVSLSQLRAMDQASFHQSRYCMSELRVYQQLPDYFLLTMTDYAKYFFIDQALVEFERYESDREGLEDIRVAFRMQWTGTQWTIWWWANSEEKARMKLERWRWPEGME